MSPHKCNIISYVNGLVLSYFTIDKIYLILNHNIHLKNPNKINIWRLYKLYPLYEFFIWLHELFTGSINGYMYCFVLSNTWFSQYDSFAGGFHLHGMIPDLQGMIWHYGQFKINTFSMFSKMFSLYESNIWYMWITIF